MSQRKKFKRIMEVVHHRWGDDDVISRMPDNVIANIMDCLPLKDAVATSILSPIWRFKWTLLTRLNFDGLPGHFDKSDISRLLLHLKQVTKFCLTITSDIKLDDADIHHWIMFLSRIRGFKELTLVNLLETPVKLPSRLFSCLDLNYLELYDCVLSPPYFHGFPKLLTLDLHDVKIPDHKYGIGDLITQCPLLQTLKIWYNDLLGEVKLVEIAKLENLKELRLSLCLLQDMILLRLSTVFQHLSLLPKLQELYLSFEKCEFLPEDVAQTAVSPNFPFLKSLTLYYMDFSSVSMLSCAFGMIFCCTNLQNLTINAIYQSNDISLPAIYPPELYCSTMGKLQLQNVRLAGIKGLENEVCLIKYILACSPMLESFEILLDWSIKSNDNAKYKFASKLLKLHRASPIAVVIF